MKKCLITSRGKPSGFVLICLLAILLVFVWVTATDLLDTILFPLFAGISIMWLAVILTYVILLLIWNRTYAISRDGITITDGTTWKRFFHGIPFRTSASATYIIHPESPMNTMR